MTKGTDKLERWTIGICPVHGDRLQDGYNCHQSTGRDDEGTAILCHQSQAVEVMPVEDAERLLRATARCGCPRGAEGEHLSDCVYDDLLGGDPLQAERRRALKAESELATLKAGVFGEIGRLSFLSSSDARQAGDRLEALLGDVGRPQPIPPEPTPEENCQCHHKPGTRRCEGCPKARMKLDIGGGGDPAGMNDAIYAAEPTPEDSEADVQQLRWAAEDVKEPAYAANMERAAYELEVLRREARTAPLLGQGLGEEDRERLRLIAVLLLANHPDAEDDAAFLRDLADRTHPAENSDAVEGEAEHSCGECELATELIEEREIVHKLLSAIERNEDRTPVEILIVAGNIQTPNALAQATQPVQEPLEQLLGWLDECIEQTWRLRGMAQSGDYRHLISRFDGKRSAFRAVANEIKSYKKERTDG